jgi:polyhydroxyalkanoate synthesis regulator phasin
MKRVSLIGLFMGLILISFMTQAAWAGEIDILVKKLVEKGILTPEEAEAIVAETKEELKKEMAEGKAETPPQWVQNIKFKGDLRVRYQGEKIDTDDDARNRLRFRLRAGVEAKVLDNTNVAFGLASGESADPRSTNQTFTDSFAKKSVWIDYAYAQWAPVKELTFTAGRMKNPFWLTSDNLWSSNINPEGGALQANYKALPNLNLFLNNAMFVVDELGTDPDDPWMVGVQPGFDWYFVPEKANLRFAFSWYEMFNETGRTLDWTAGTNTLRPGNDGLRYDYDELLLDGLLGFKEPFSDIPYLGDCIHYVGIFANGVINPNPDEENLGGLIGFAFGDEKVSKRGQWQIMTRYEYLGRDAWPDISLDSDTYGGRTNVKGPKVKLDVGLMDNVTAALTYYNTKLITGHGQHPQNLWQCDVNWKF